MRLILSVAFIWVVESRAAVQPYVELSAIPSDSSTLTKDDFKVSFSKEGLSISSKRPLQWGQDEGSSLKFESVASNGNEQGFSYGVKVKDTKENLPKSTSVSLKDNRIRVRIDKEALPISQEHTGTAGITGVRTHDDLNVKPAKVVFVLGALIAVFLGVVFILKRVGTKHKWLSGFLGNEKYKAGPLLELVSKHALGPKRQVIVLRAGGEYLLVGCSGDTMTLLTKIDEQTVSEENDLLETQIKEKNAEAFQ